MPDDELASAALSELAECRPEVVALARAASVAAIVEPALLRRLRLEVPGLAPPGVLLHAGTEADLWFSRLAHVATAGQFTLRPAIAETLRQQLAEPQYQAVARAARRIVRDAHARHPDMIRLEERVIWSTIMGDTADVGQALDRALAAIRLGPERAVEVVRWVMQARRRLPSSALSHPSGRRLLAAVAMHTDRVVPAELLAADRFPDAIGDLAPTGLPMTTVGAELVEGGIRFVPDGQPTAATIALPDTRPLVLEARWYDSDEVLHRAVIVAQPGTATALSGLDGPVRLRTLAGQRVRLRTAHVREVVIAVFGMSPGMERERELITTLSRVPDVTLRIDDEPDDLYSSKAEVIVIGPDRSHSPSIGEFATAFVRAAARARFPAGEGDAPGAVVWVGGGGRGDVFPGWLREFDDPDGDRMDAVEDTASAVRSVIEHPGRMYELDLDSALAMLQSLALAFYTRYFYVDEVGPEGERSLFDLGDESTDIAYEMFGYVRRQCEWIFDSPTRRYLDSSDEDLGLFAPPDPRWSVFPAHPPLFSELLPWFVRQLHHYTELLRDRLGPRQMLMADRCAVSPDVLEACRLALGLAAFPLGQEHVQQHYGDKVSYMVERSRLPGLISALAEPILEAVVAAAAERSSPSVDHPILMAAGGDPVTSVAFFPDGILLATAGSEPVVRIWNVATRQQVAALHGHTDSVSALAVAPDGTWLATGSDDMTLRIWDASTWDEKVRLVTRYGDASVLVAGLDGTWLAGGGDYGTVRIWDTSTWRERAHVYPSCGRVAALATAPVARWLAVGGSEGLMLVDAVTEDMRRPALGFPRAVSGLAFFPDASHLVISDTEGDVWLWDPSNDQVTATPAGHPGLVNPLALPGLVNPVAVGYTTDGRILLAAAGEGNSVRIWNPVSGTLTTEFAGHTGPVNALAFNPSARILASASVDGTVRFWDTRTGESAR